MKIETVIAPNPGPFTLDGTRTYVIERRIVVDPGPDITSHLDAIAKAADGIAAIFVTHRHGDHAPGAVSLRKTSGARLFASRGTLPDHEIDVLIEDEGRYTVGDITITAVATPGHTEEHFCFLSADGDLFTGDTVLGEGTTTIFPPDGHMGSYLKSLSRLRGLEPRRIYPGHGPVREDAGEWIDWYIEHRLERERQILGQLSEKRATVSELRTAIYPSLDPQLHRAAEIQIVAHLIHLQEKAEVVSDGETFIAA